MLKGLTKTSLWEFLLFIQEKAKSNKELIRQNSHEIDKIYAADSTLKSSAKKGVRLSELLSENRKLGDENELLFNLHSKILEISGEYSWHTIDNAPQLPKNTESFSDLNSNEDYLEAILKSNLPLNKNLPFLKNESAVDNILNGLIAHERYEECAAIRNLVEKQSGLKTGKSLFARIKRIFKKETNK